MEEVANNKGKLHAAMSKLQGELRAIERTAEVNAGSYKFKYAPLDKIMEVLYPLLGKNELSVRHELVEGGIECVVSHSSGEEIRSGAIRIATTGDMKNIGGQITYARRYSVTMMFGIASDEDTDAGDLNVPATQQTAKDAIQNMNVDAQIKELEEATDLVKLRQIWIGFTVAQRENVKLIEKKEEMKAILEQEAVEVQEAPDEEEVPFETDEVKPKKKK